MSGCQSVDGRPGIGLWCDTAYNVYYVKYGSREDVTFVRSSIWVIPRQSVGGEKTTRLSPDARALL